MGKSIIVKGADFSVNGIAPEFERLSWVSPTSNSQYFDSKIKRTGKLRVEIEFSLTDDMLSSDNIGKGCYLFGCYVPAGTNDVYRAWWLPYDATDKRVYAQAGGDLWQNTSSMLKNTNKHIVSLDSSKFLFDGITIGSTNSPIITDGNSNIYIMNQNPAITSSGANNKARLYDIKMYSDYADNSTLIFHGVPVKRLEDNKICLLDIVSGNYILTNDGTNPNYGTLE